MTPTAAQARTETSESGKRDGATSSARPRSSPLDIKQTAIATATASVVPAWVATPSVPALGIGTVQRKTAVGARAGDGTAPSIVRSALQGSGEPLSASTRETMEPHFARDFSRVRIHTGAQAAAAARAVDAEAYTVGRHVVFGPSSYAPHTPAGRALLAHELTHVVQQGASEVIPATLTLGGRHDLAEHEANNAASVVSKARGGRVPLDVSAAPSSAGRLQQGRGSPLVQRYEAGEHAQTGETQAELKALYAPIRYTVRKGDTPSSIARKFGISVAELRDANKDKLRNWPANADSTRTVEGFNAGETISIPQALNAFEQAALKDPSAQVTINGVVMDYGIAIAMGDLYEDPTQMAAAPASEITALVTLIQRERSGGAPVTTTEWETATGGRYLKLAEKNVAHFAPQNKAFVTPSAAGATSPNHQSAWEKYHREALDASVAGDKDKALRINAFADHFLTDAFAAGHLVNKTDVMEQATSQLKLVKVGKELEFDAPSKAFFDAVAKDAFVGSVKTEFSLYETVKTYTFGVHADIDSESRFSTLLQEIHKVRPDLMANAVARGLHDTLNTIPGGLPVVNKRGDGVSTPWKLSGDNTLNADTLKVVRRAVAQSQADVISAYKMVGPLDYARLYRQVWDYTPQPTPAGQTTLVDAVAKGTTITSPDLILAVVNLIKKEYLVIIDKLVNVEKKLKKI